MLNPSGVESAKQSLRGSSVIQACNYIVSGHLCRGGYLGTQLDDDSAIGESWHWGLLSPWMVMANCQLLGWVATKWLVEAWTGGVRLLGEVGSVPDSLIIKSYTG